MRAPSTVPALPLLPRARPVRLAGVASRLPADQESVRTVCIHSCPSGGVYSTQRTPVFDLLAARLVTESPFRGACVDTGAQKSVIGKPQAQAYCKGAPIPFKPKLRHARRLYKFGDRKFEGMRLLKIRILVIDDFFLSFEVEIVNVDVPLLIGLERLDTFKVSIDLANDRMLSRDGEWEIHLKRDQGHLFVIWNVQAGILVTLPELRKCHRHFYHPNSQRLFAILRRSRREEFSPQILQQLE